MPTRMGEMLHLHGRSPSRHAAPFCRGRATALQTASKFPLRWWILNATVFAYIDSTPPQSRIAAGERLQRNSSCIFKTNGLHWPNKVS